MTRGGPMDGGLKRRVEVIDVAAKLDALVKHVSDLVTEIHVFRDSARTSFRLLFGTIVTAGLVLATLLAKGFHWF